MPGKVIRVLKNVGESVRYGDAILVLEAMKMEMPITAPVHGTLKEIKVKSGDQVAIRDVLAYIS